MSQYNYHESYEAAVRAEQKLKLSYDIIDLRKHNKRYWIVEFKKRSTE